MKICSLSDLHGRADALEHIDRDLAAADVVLVTGDITHFGDSTDAKRILADVMSHNDTMLAVAGNVDRPGVPELLVDMGISLDCRSRVIDGIAFAGVGAALPAPGGTPNEADEEQFALYLREAVRETPEDVPLVLVLHQPPYGTALDRVHNGRHVGSREVLRFIAERQPAVCFCGHIHESAALDTLDGTKLCNPGPLRLGGYAWATFEPDDVQVELRHWR